MSLTVWKLLIIKNSCFIHVSGSNFTNKAKCFIMNSLLTIIINNWKISSNVKMFSVRDLRIPLMSKYADALICKKCNN